MPAAKKSRVELLAKIAAEKAAAAAAAAAGTEMTVEEVGEGGTSLATGTGAATATATSTGVVSEPSAVDTDYNMEIEDWGRPVAVATEQPPPAVSGHAARYTHT